MTRPGDKTRTRILDRATHIASVDGLDGVTIGGLAAEVAVSKGAVANHFPAKEQLQIATIETAAGIVAERILGAAADVEPGLPRLRAAVDAWLDYLEDPPFEGGCFFGTTSIEYGRKPGPVRDVLASAVRAGLALLLEQARLAQRLGELPGDPGAEQIVFEVHAFLQEANWARRILDDPTAIDRARAAIAHRLAPEDRP